MTKTENQDQNHQDQDNLDQQQQQADGLADAAGADGAADLEAVDEAAIWDEIDKEEAAAKADPDAVASDKDAGAAADAKAGKSKGAANQQPASDDAAAAGGKQAANAAGSQQQQEDIWANASPAQQAAFKAAQEAAQKGEQYRKSNEGRITALQRKIDELSKQPAAVAKQAAELKGMSPEARAKFVKEYPEFQGIVDELDMLRARNTTLEKEMAAVGNDRRQTALSEQQELLAKEHADWTAVAGREDFGPWLDQQPRHILEAFMRNAKDIVDAREAADVIGRFKDHLRASGQYQDAQQQGNGTAQQQNNGTQAGNGDGNDAQLDGKRQRQAVSASSARSRGPGVASGIPETADEKVLWNMWDEHDRKQAAARA